jgi:hypothetical protein
MGAFGNPYMTGIPLVRKVAPDALHHLCAFLKISSSADLTSDGNLSPEQVTLKNPKPSKAPTELIPQSADHM